MPKSPLWTNHSSGGTAGSTGTTDLTLVLPDFAVDGDLLVAAISHKGAGYGVWPAGWTLIDRQIEGSTRGELYWKRALGEPANYAITGLADTATGVIAAYQGLVTAGNPVIASSFNTITGAGTLNLPALVLTDPNVLLVGMIATGANNSSFSAVTSPNIDLAITIFAERKRQATTGGTDSTCVLWDSVKIILGNTSLLAISGSTADRVGIWVAFLPDITTTTAGSRYYLSSRYPDAFMLMGELDGNWAVTWDGPRGYGIGHFTWLLSQTKPGSGRRNTLTQTCNLIGANCLFARWMTPLLEAQTIAGTINLMNRVYAQWSDCSGLSSILSTVVYRLHIYIAVGQTTDVRHVLLDQYEDAAANKWPGTAAWRALASAQALTAGACEDGDRVIIELGARIISSPTPVPTLLPSDWTIFSLLIGATLTSGSTPVGGKDGFVGAVTGDEVPFIDFSQTLVEKAYDAAAHGPIPTNTTCATATTISSFPFTDGPHNTNYIPDVGHELWYTWTPASDQRVIAHTFGANGSVSIDVKKGTCGSLASLSAAEYVQNHEGQAISSITAYSIIGLAGVTYFFRLFQAAAVGHSLAGGSHSFTVVEYQPPINNDVFIATAGYVLCYRDGLLVNAQTDFAGLVSLTGLAIDYTKQSLENFNGGFHTEDRLYVGVFKGGPGLGNCPPDGGTGGDFIEILDIATLNAGESEINYMFEAVGSSVTVPRADRNEGMASLAINASGRLVVGWFGSGFTRVAGSFESFQASVSQSVDAEINVLDVLDADGFGPPPNVAARYPVTLEGGGTNYLEFDQDDSETIYYVSSDWYVPSAGGQTVFRMNTSTGAQLPNFATVPASSGPNPGLKGLFPLPFNQGILICNGNEIVRLNTAGQIVQTYIPSDPLRSQSLADVELNADGDAFYVIDEATTTLWKFDLESGAELLDHWTMCGGGSLTSLVVYRTTPFIPPDTEELPPGCPPANLAPLPFSPLHGCPPSTPSV